MAIEPDEFVDLKIDLVAEHFQQLFWLILHMKAMLMAKLQAKLVFVIIGSHDVQKK